MKKGNLVSEVPASDLFSTFELLGSQGVQGRDLKNLRSNKLALKTAARVIRFLLDNYYKGIIADFESLMEVKYALNMSNICLALEKTGWKIYSSWRAKDSDGPVSQYRSLFKIKAEKGLSECNTLIIDISAGDEDNECTHLSVGEEGNEYTQFCNDECEYLQSSFKSVEVQLFMSLPCEYESGKYLGHWGYVTADELTEVINNPLDFAKKQKEERK